MGNPNVSIFSPDKVIKDLIWNDLVEASKYAHGRLLDIGCGDKPYEQIFQHAVIEHIGIDKRSIKADIRGDIFDARIKNESFDTILCTQVLEHVADPEKLLKKAYQILKPNGVIILTAPLISALHEQPNDYFRFTKFGLIYILEKAGFKIKHIREEGNWISSLGNLSVFYLESTFNRYYLKYPKLFVQFAIQWISLLMSGLPKRITKPERCPINYIAVAKKA